MALAFDPVRRSSETHSPTHSSGRASPDQKVDSVSLQIIHSELDRNSPVPSFQGRVLIPQDPEEGLECKEVDAVARCALGVSPQGVNGYVLIPENREFRKEDCLAGESAPLWLSSQIGSGGIGRSVQMTKDIEDKEKKPEEDIERQAKLAR